jgi:hypothetical protein
MLEAASVEGLVGMIKAHPRGESAEVWVPDQQVTMGGVPVPQQPTGIVEAVLTDAALAIGLWPDGVVVADGGRILRFTPTA